MFYLLRTKIGSDKNRIFMKSKITLFIEKSTLNSHKFSDIKMQKSDALIVPV